MIVPQLTTGNSLPELIELLKFYNITIVILEIVHLEGMSQRVSLIGLLSVREKYGKDLSDYNVQFLQGNFKGGSFE